MDYEKMTLVELREAAKALGIKGVSSMKKGELAELLTAVKGHQMEKKTEEQSNKASEAVRTGEKAAGKRTVDKRPADNKKTNRKAADSRAKDNETADNRAAGNKKTNRKEAGSRTKDSETVGRRAADNKEAGRKAADNKTVDRPKLSEKGEVGEPEHNREDKSEPVEQEKAAPISEAAEMEPQNLNSEGVGGEPREHKAVEGIDGSLDSGKEANGILEVMADGFGFLRCENYLPGENDVYVSPAQIKRFNLKTGDIIVGNRKVKTEREKFAALLYIKTVNGYTVEETIKRKSFEDLTPIFPDKRIQLENEHSKTVSMRIMDLLAPIGKGQRGMIVAPPKAGKTTLLKQIAVSISRKYRDMHLIVLLIDERPEEVTDIRESIEGPNVEVIYSTFDELPEHHKRVAEMVLERAKRLVEHKEDVVILLDSITRLARAYNLTVPPSGRTLTGGLDPAALHMPKKFFGAARNMREGGSLTVLATALVETGSKMDDVVFEEFKGTGNMELVLDRKLSERRIFPAIDIAKSGTRRDDLLLTPVEKDIVNALSREFNSSRAEERIEEILKLFVRTKDNKEFIEMMRRSLSRR